MEKFKLLFAEKFDETEESLFTIDTNFRDLDEWDSLTTLLIISMVDEEYDVALTKEDFQTANTIGDLYNIIQRKK